MLPLSVKPATLDPDLPLSDPHWYRTIVGSLQYLTITKPEIAFAVNLACQHMHDPHESHLIAVKCILRYVQGSIHQGLSFVPGPMTLTSYTDANWAGNHSDRRSTTGFCVYFGSNLITWCAKK